MANISSVFGDISIIAPSINDLAVFAYYFQKANENVTYYTNITDIEEFDKFDDVLNFIKNNYTVINNNDSKTFEFNSSFTAAGRWTFECNLEWFFDLIKYKNEIETLSKKSYNEVIESIKINIHYTEDECGCCFIDKATATLKDKKTEDNKYESDIIISHDEYEFTVDNLKNMCGYSDVYSINDALKNMSDYFTEDALKKHKRDINKALKSTSKDQRKCVYFDIDEMFEDLDIKINPDYLIKY